MDVTYAVDLVVISPGNADLSTNIPTYLDWREKIRRAFQRVKFSGVPTVYMTDIEAGEAFDRNLTQDNYDYMLLTILFSSFEQAANS